MRKRKVVKNKTTEFEVKVSEANDDYEINIRLDFDGDVRLFHDQDTSLFTYITQPSWPTIKRIIDTIFKENNKEKSNDTSTDSATANSNE